MCQKVQRYTDLQNLVGFSAISGHSPFRAGPELAVQFPQTSVESDKQDLRYFLAMYRRVNKDVMPNVFWEI